MKAHEEEFYEMDDWTERVLLQDQKDSNSFNIVPGVVVEAPWRDESKRGEVLRVIIDKSMHELPDSIEAGDSLRKIDGFNDLEEAIKKYSNGNMSSFSFEPTFETDHAAFFEFH